MFHQWWDVDLETRLWYDKKMADYQQNLKGDDKKNFDKKLNELVKNSLQSGNFATAGKSPNKENVIGHNDMFWFKQASTCHRSDYLVAKSFIAQGAYAKVEEMYRKNLDLDPWLAISQGNAALIQHHPSKANEAFRQAIRLSSSTNSKAYAHLGLALYFAEKGEWRFAKPLFEKAAQIQPNDNLTTYLWLDNARTNSQSPKENLSRARAWRNNNPTSPTAQVAYLREARLGDFSKEFTSIQKATNDFFHDALQLQAPNGELIGAYVQFLVLSNRLNDAKTTLDKYRYLRNAPAMLLARADLVAVQGNETKSNELLIKAGKIAAHHPGYVIFLQKDALQ